MHCINISHPDYQALKNSAGIHPSALKAMISVWMDKNGNEKFPSLEQLGLSKKDSKKSEKVLYNKKKLNYYQQDTACVVDDGQRTSCVVVELERRGIGQGCGIGELERVAARTNQGLVKRRCCGQHSCTARGRDGLQALVQTVQRQVAVDVEQECLGNSPGRAGLNLDETVPHAV